jgi:DNA-binding NarL/FixJ family response regulator
VDNLIPAAAPIGDDGAMARTVLVVDDSATFRATARAVLEARGYEVVGAVPDGATALSTARALGPDAVVLDVSLPDIGGIGVARELTAGADGPVVVLVSTLDESALGEGVESCGARGFIAKADLTSSSLVDLLGPP